MWCARCIDWKTQLAFVPGCTESFPTSAPIGSDNGWRSRGATQPLGDNDVATEAPVESSDDEIATLRAAIAELPADKRAILSMFYVDDLSIREIAVVLAVPEGTIKSRMFHARSQLKQILEEKNR